MHSVDATRRLLSSAISTPSSGASAATPDPAELEAESEDLRYKDDQPPPVPTPAPPLYLRVLLVKLGELCVSDGEGQAVSILQSGPDPPRSQLLQSQLSFVDWDSNLPQHLPPPRPDALWSCSRLSECASSRTESRQWSRLRFLGSIGRESRSWISLVCPTRHPCDSTASADQAPLAFHVSLAGVTAAMLPLTDAGAMLRASGENAATFGRGAGPPFTQPPAHSAPLSTFQGV